MNDGEGQLILLSQCSVLDQTVIEFKLAANKKLEQNLKSQAEIYQRASDAHGKLKVIIYFTDKELARVTKVLQGLGLKDSPDIILVDARPKRSASVA